MRIFPLVHNFIQAVDSCCLSSTAFVEIVAPYMSLVKVDKGDYVVTEGERGTDIFFVLTGAVTCEYESDNGTKYPLMKYSKGQYFGDVAMFILEKNIVSYKATEVEWSSESQLTAPKCELYMLPRHTLLQLAFETKGDGNAHNHAEVKHEMQTLANEKLRLLSEQIATVDEWVAGSPERDSVEQQASGTTTEMTDVPKRRGRRMLSRVLDAADAELAVGGSTISSGGSFELRRRSPR